MLDGSCVASCRIVERMAGRHCGGTMGHEEGIRSCGSSSGLQVNETARCGFVLDGMIAAIWNGSLHESVLVNEKQRGLHRNLQSFSQ